MSPLCSFIAAIKYCMIFSYDHKIIHVGRDMRRFLLQPTAQSVGNSEVSLGHLMVDLIELGKRRETAQISGLLSACLLL